MKKKYLIKNKFISYLPLQFKAIVRIVLGKSILDESDLVAYLFKHDRKSQNTIFDIGAHHGGALAAFLFKGWKTYAFEPDDENRKRLSDNFGDYTNLIIDSRAVSNKSQKNASFYVSNKSAGISTLSPFHNSHRKSEKKIDIITLKQFCNEYNITLIDFLKIDVEGYDYFVLQGLNWDEILPKVILAEFEDKKTLRLGYSVYDMADFLVSKGYHVLVSEWYPIVEYGTTHKWRRFIQYPCKLVDENAFGNIIAVKDYSLFQNLLEVTNMYQELINKFKKFRIKNRF